MLEFVKGSPDRLEGRGVIYTRGRGIRIGDYNEVIQFYSVFMGTNPGDVFDVAESHGLALLPEAKGVVESNYNMSLENARARNNAVADEAGRILSELDKVLSHPETDHEDIQQIMSIAESMVSPLKSMASKTPQISCMISQLPAIEEPSPEGVVGDVLRAADFPGSLGVMEYLTGLGNSYIILYGRQQEAMIPDAGAYKSPLNNFREMRPAELKQTLYGLVAEAVNTAETGGDTSRVFADLKQVLRGSPFIGDAVNLVKLAESNRPDRHPLMMLYMDKITAVIDEDYEKAQEVKGKIDKLLL